MCKCTVFLHTFNSVQKPKNRARLSDDPVCKKKNLDVSRRNNGSLLILSIWVSLNTGQRGQN